MATVSSENRKKRKQYPGEFKQKVIEDMRKNGLSQRETAHKYGIVYSMINRWERIYLEEGAEALYIERRGRSNNKPGRLLNLSQSVEKDLISENQRLRAENDYLKKLDALVQNRAQQEKKPRQSGN